MASLAAENDDGGGGGRRRFPRLPLLPPRRDHPSAALPDRNPLLASSPPTAAAVASKKKSFASVAFRGLGCTSAAASQVYTPPAAAAAAVRASADWQAKRSRSRRKKGKARKKDKDRSLHPPPPPLHAARRNQVAAAADLWCAPGIAFAAAGDSVDCVVSHHQHRPPPPSRGRAMGAERAQRERPCIARPDGSNQRQIFSLLDSPQSSLDVPLFGSDMMLPGHYRHSRGFHRSPGGLEEIMMFQTRLLLGGMDVYDRYRDLRLDVDNMTYEELLELGDRIGHVNTGLREEEILRCLRTMKHLIFDVSPLHFSTEMEWKCSICQEEYEVNDEVGKLECGHSYHMYCIKEWLLRKNACPVCKTAAAKS